MIINKTNGNVISEQEIVCKTVMSQALGLMFRPKQNLVMIFPEEKQISLHMFFVFYPIDVLIVNKDKKIVEIKKKIRQFTFWRSTTKGKYVVELGIPKIYSIGETIEFQQKY